jgi:hypothetical protein
MEERTLSGYIDQVHGVASLAVDVDALVIDSAFAGKLTSDLPLAMSECPSFEVEGCQRCRPRRPTGVGRPRKRSPRSKARSPDSVLLGATVLPKKRRPASGRVRSRAQRYPDAGTFSCVHGGSRQPDRLQPAQYHCLHNHESNGLEGRSKRCYVAPTRGCSTKIRDSQMLTSSHSQSTCADASPPMSLASGAALLTTTAWSPKADLTVTDWVGQGRWLGALGRGTGWWIGDWVRYGNARYGERYVAAARVTGYDLQSLRNMAYVAGRFEVSRRREALSFSHHAELAGLPGNEQDLWLDRAEASALSVRSLRSELRDARRRRRSRAALAQALRQRNHAVASNRAHFADVLEAPMLAASPRNARGTAVGSGLGSDVKHNQSDTAFEVVCPTCGSRFSPTAHREGERELLNNWDKPRARLAPTQTAQQAGV